MYAIESSECWGSSPDTAVVVELRFFLPNLVRLGCGMEHESRRLVLSACRAAAENSLSHIRKKAPSACFELQLQSEITSTQSRLCSLRPNYLSVLYYSSPQVDVWVRNNRIPRGQKRTPIPWNCESYQSEPNQSILVIFPHLIYAHLAQIIRN